MGIWAWVQPVDRIWKVVSDEEKGELLVYNEKSDLVMERKGLSKEELSFIEQNFLNIVATSLSGNKPNLSEVTETKKPASDFNHMYA